jgi:nitrous oxide reductase accessory protein NosL
MDRTAFSHSRMLVTYSDGEEAGICSLHCAVIEMKKNSGRKIRTIMVADYYSRKLTDARTAVWVIGGNKRGVMSPVAKWAFAAKKDAERFVKENGGKIATFDDAMRRTEEDFE